MAEICTGEVGNRAVRLVPAPVAGAQARMPKNVKPTKARPFRAPLAKAVRDAREAAGISQGELARRLRTSQARVSRIECGHQGLSLAWAVRISIALGTTVAGILQYVDGFYGLVARELHAMGGREHLEVHRIDGRPRVKRVVTFEHDAGKEW